MSWNFWLPASFDPAEVLPTDLAKSHDEARYLMSCIIRKMLHAENEQGYVALHSQVLRQIVDSHVLAPLWRSLEAAGYVEINHSYRRGHHSKGYRLGAKVLNDQFVVVQPTKRSLIRKLARAQERFDLVQQQRQQAIHVALNAMQHRCLSVSMGEALIILPELTPHAQFVQRALLGNIVDHCMTNTIGSTGRWFNAITGISRRLRQCLRINGQPLAGVDLTSCQPALLAYLAKVHGRSREANLTTYMDTPGGAIPGLAAACERCAPVAASELAWFADAVSSGRFYDWLVAETGLTRCSAKKQFLANILAPRRLFPCPIRSALGRVCPSLLRFIRKINADDLGELIRILQRLESWLVVESVAPRLLGRCDFLTLHDAIYCQAADMPVVRNAFEQVFDEIGFRIAMKDLDPASRCGSLRKTETAVILRDRQETCVRMVSVGFERCYLPCSLNIARGTAFERGSILLKGATANAVMHNPPKIESGRTERIIMSKS